MILVQAQGVSASRPEKPLFADLSLTVSSGDRLGLVGVNGTGKSTLLRVLAGRTAPESGAIVRGRDARVVMLDQADSLPQGTVRAAVAPGGHPEREWEVDAILDRLGVGELADTDVTLLSGGQTKRVALARALVEVGPGGGPDDDAVLLLLDEPTNHLDIDAIAWLEERLDSHRGGLVLVTHDRHVLDRVTNRIVELDRGGAYVHDGGYQAYLEGRQEREERAAAAESVRRNLARRELAWLRRGAPARTSKPRARVASATELVTSAAPTMTRRGDLPLHAVVPRLGDQVVELHGVGHRFSTDDPWLFRHVDLALDSRERLGIVGPNGAGKSTLLGVIAGRVAPAEGTVVTGSTVRLALWDQLGVGLDPTVRVRDAVAGPNRSPDWTDAALLERFWFDGDAQWAPIGLLSGGERRRLQLLLTLVARPNVLLLDEPTNDLDLDTLRSLEDFLTEWPGALVVVSHDRAFLERTVADVIVIDEDHDAERVRGGYDAWETVRRAAQRSGTMSVAKANRATPRSGTPGATRRPVKPGRSGSAGSGSGPGSGRRSHTTLRFAMDELDRQMRKLAAEYAEVAAELETVDPTDHVALADVGRRLAAVDAKLRVAEDEWLALGEEAES